jgi:hypothetical protein
LPASHRVARTHADRQFRKANPVGLERTAHAQSRTERQTDDHSDGSNAQKPQSNLQVATLGMSSSVDALFAMTKAFGMIAFITIS